MQIRSLKELDRVSKDSPISPSIRAQLEAELKKQPKVAGRANGRRKGVGSPAPPPELTPQGSKGEQALEPALTKAFGIWAKGGEVVRELIPFPERNFRADFALPRYRITVEVEGWTHHGASLDDHHDDRLRGLYFAARDWLIMNVSHGQALNEHELIIESIRSAMSLRPATNRAHIEIEEIKTAKNLWHRLILGGGAQKESSFEGGSVQSAALGAAPGQE